MTIFKRETTSIVMRYILATILVSLNFFSVNGQTKATDPAVVATAASVAGTYTCQGTCIECDSKLTSLKFTTDPNSDGGTFTITKINIYDDASRRVMYRYTGEWYILPNKTIGDNTSIIVADIDDLPEHQENFMMLLLRKDGTLQELNRKNPEIMPLYVFKDTAEHDYYIARRRDHPIPMRKMLYDKYNARNYLNPTLEHIYRRK